MPKFKLFLQQSNFKEDLLEAKLTKVLVDDILKSWHFFVSFQNAPSPTSYDDFLDKIALYFTIKGVVDEVLVSFYVENDSWKENAVIYYQWILSKLIDKRSSCSIFNNFKVEFNDGFILYVDKEHNRYQKIAKWLMDEFKYYGLETTFSFKIDATIQSPEAALSQRRAKAQTEIAFMPKIEKKPEPISVKNYKRNFKGEKVSPIKEIPKTNYELDKLLNTKSDASYTIEGEIIETEVRKLTRVHLLTMVISDKEDSIIVKQFLNNDKAILEAEQLQVGFIVRCSGRASFDTYIKDVVLMANRVDSISTAQLKERKDKEKNKRIEFHVHTKMSNLDGVTSAKDYIDQAIKWGHKAIAFTDHDGLYAFPEIYQHSKGKDIKPIYGVELAYFDETKFKMAYHESDIDLRKATYVVFDLETTGLSSTRDKIIEISAVKLQNLQVVDRFNMFVNPEEKLSNFTKELTSISDEDLVDAETIDTALPKFIDFIGSSILVAHNASFDLSHLYQKMIDLGLPLIKYPSIDTIALARYFYDDLNRFNLKAVARYFKVKLEQHHRAEADSQATAEIFLKMLGDLFEKGIYNHLDINKNIDYKKAYKCGFPNHVTILTQTQEGYKNLFKLVSEALTDYFHDGPRLTKTTLEKYRQGLLVGSSCYKGEVFEAALYKSDQELIDA
ncbi:MAG: exonuclease domain-containing protein, partial [Acholeplasmataceae bacterium]